jgi:N-acetylmuramoyl-L-alanine amidase
MFTMRIRQYLLILLLLFCVELKATATGSVAPLIVIDAGHGGSDEGAKVQTVMEKRITLTTALLAKKHLEKMGYRVILTRSRDIFVSLPRRSAIANKSKAAAFVSIHFNSSPNRSAKGIEIYFYETKDPSRSRASKKLANTVLYEIVDQTAAVSRGARKGNFHVVRETMMPAVLVEGGFMTNYEERFLLKDRKYLEKIAKGIALGVQKFLS